MNNLRRALIGALLLAPFVFSGKAQADPNNFYISRFNSAQTLSDNDRQGELRIVENIDVVFLDQNHGLLRAIPDRYNGRSLQIHINQVSSKSGAPSDFTTYESNGNTVLKIGSPNYTVTGNQQYTIDYTVHNVISFFDDHDELYWNVNGNQWAQTFLSVQAIVELPKNTRQIKSPVCYTGSQGSTERNCQIIERDNVVQINTTKPLGSFQNLTYALAFDKGYFSSPSWYERISDYANIIFGIGMPILILGGGGFIIWFRRGRDAKGTGVVVPQYDSPDSLSPIKVGKLMGFTVSGSAVTATIIDLAVRGYLKINEIKQVKRLAKDTVTYSLELVNADFSKLDDNEKSILNAVFPTSKQGDTVKLDSLKNTLYKVVDALNKSTQQQLVDDGYMKPATRGQIKNGVKSFSKIRILLIVAFLIFCAVKGGTLFMVGGIIGLGIGLAFLSQLDARTAKGVFAKEHILGLKKYLNVAEKDRLDKLQSPNAKYAKKSEEPQKTVELFEKLLPYAIILGVENGWAKQFEALYKTPPDWYSGASSSSFSATTFTNSLNTGFGASTVAAFSAPSSSGGGSGFSGGSSGGGGGGGGGGGW